MRFRNTRIGILLLVSAMACGSTVAWEDEPAKPAESNESHEEALAHVRRMRCRTLAEKEKAIESVTLSLREKPILTFTDPARGNSDGTVWCWPAKGRPAAMLELFRYTDSDQWLHFVTLTSDKVVRLEAPELQAWLPDDTQVEWTIFPEKTKVEDTAAARLRQMKSLASGFSAHEFWHPNRSRYELRLLVSPALRYDDADAGIVDGAVFVIAHGTNPEVLVMIEAQSDREEASKESQWKYGFARMSAAESHVFLEGREVWTAPTDVGGIGDPYYFFRTSGSVIEK